MPAGASKAPPWAHLRSVVALSGGVGGARLVDGLARALAPEALTVVVNTGDDLVHWGLRICPDLDTVMYTLAELCEPSRGWGVRDESFAALGMVQRYGGEAWFQLGDRDLGTHLMRTERLARGLRLTEITAELSAALGVRTRLLPMSDAPRPTRVETLDGKVLDFQDWLVRRRAQPRLRRVGYGAEGGASPEVLEAIDAAELVILGPSNPFVSLDPILALPGLRAMLRTKRVVGVSPLIGGRAVKGPLVEMIESIEGCEPSAAFVARRYADMLDGFVVERGDEAGIEIATLPTSTWMRTADDRLRLAEALLAFGASLR
ncbi:MAG: 2-phospho-L-lactate transferase [Myxococcales bacterium]|nr:2-phospho-L-lactate transferase [Myxococcales bacterium]